MHDIINASTLATFILFADYTSIFSKDKCLNTLYDTINDELNKIANWFKLNKLFINIKKTNYILFRAGHKLIKNFGVGIKIDNDNMEKVDHTKFLGVIVNDILNWNDHIKTVCK